MDLINPMRSHTTTAASRHHSCVLVTCGEAGTARKAAVRVASATLRFGEDVSPNAVADIISVAYGWCYEDDSREGRRVRTTIFLVE